MLTFEELEQRARKLGVAIKDLAAAAGYSGHWRRLRKSGRLEDLPYASLVRLAVLVQLSPDQFFGGSSSKVLTSGSRESELWIPYHRNQTDKMTVFNTEMKECREVLTLTEGIDNYLLTNDWMLEWLNVDWRRVSHWDEHKQLYLPYVQENRRVREDGTFLHRVVCPKSLFEDAGRQNPDWLRELKHCMGLFEDWTVVGPTENWASLRMAINHYLSTWLQDWEKIVVVGRETMMIYLYRKVFVRSFDISVIENIIDVVDRFAEKNLISAEFPSSRLLTRKQVRCGAAETWAILEKMLPTRRRRF